MKIFKTRPNKSPKIYGYTELSPEYDGLIKIGYTEREVKDRMKEHYPTLGPKGIERYRVLIEESSMRNDGTSFIDKDVHRILENASLHYQGLTKHNPQKIGLFDTNISAEEFFEFK